MSVIDVAGHSRAGPGETPAEPSASAVDMPVAGAGAVYLLVFNDPEAPVEHYGLGWTLVTCGDHGAWCWRSLAGYGAGANVDAGTARAAAVQVLTAQGVSVRGWHTGDGPARRMFRADCAQQSPAAAADAIGGMPRVEVGETR